ncbi:heavy metal translocating P-type ATPase [Streptomyces sp. 549]|uniref:heavy metal translocating P-type ATPase n=1 Tax=Streptomyces sp. 549 TaxID=3049076 RepID=UPI0024C2E965|nr:heavy metal translocating P-type ATPase [Streptomyces sp. 549]MDK1475261.1 heavy metal translocating P-type ATPase [Streptomyces sp. 549]
MTFTATRPPAPRPDRAAALPGPYRVLLTLPEARWAALATAAFLVGVGLHFGGAPSWLPWAAWVLCYAAGGWDPARSGLAALAERTLDVDLLMVVAALAAAAIGQPLEGALLIVIFATSGALEAFATRRTEDSVRSLLELAPQRACRVGPDGREEVVAAERLVVGDLVVVRPGERVGADGIVTGGTSDVDQASVTGEGIPVPRTEGDEVFAGTLNGSGVLRVRVRRPAHDSVIARIVAAVEEASATKAPRQLFVERIEQRYAVGMVAATVAVFAVPMLLGADLEPSLLRAMTFMVVASPCAVVLATMPPLLAAVATAGRHGVLVKSAAVLERLGSVDQVVLDKTGTLTEGRPRLAEVRPFGQWTERELLRIAAAAERGSEHPLGRAVAAAAPEEESLPVSDFEALPGRGVRARVAGRDVEISAPRGTAAAAVAALERDGCTVAEVRVDGEPAGLLGLVDRPRADAAAAVARLELLTGRPPLLLTGDRPAAATRLAGLTGIRPDRVRAALLPQDKADAVRELERSGSRVLAVGDGVNDAPALAAAHAGIAMGGSGADLTLRTADAVLVRDELAAVPALVALSRRARRLVLQNLVIAGTAIVVLVTWDLVWHLPLPLGVAGHEGSTVLVGLNGLRLLRDRAWRA